MFEKSHVVLITLEAVHHHEQVYADKTCFNSPWVLFVSISYLSFADFIRALNFLYEDGIRVDAIALLKDNWADFCQRLLKSLSLNFQLGVTNVHLHMTA